MQFVIHAVLTCQSSPNNGIHLVVHSLSRFNAQFLYRHGEGSIAASYPCEQLDERRMNKIDLPRDLPTVDGDPVLVAKTWNYRVRLGLHNISIYSSIDGTIRIETDLTQAPRASNEGRLYDFTVRFQVVLQELVPISCISTALSHPRRLKYRQR